MVYQWKVFWGRLMANFHGLWGLLRLEPHQIAEYYDRDDKVLMICCWQCKKVFFEPQE